ncbi:ead/Ea22-like family protein [Klebsiella pneumoniae]|uniref:hypothetical protein n=1 Tax=Klebsiella pneumoniae TaxID=573 RepID=UPI0010A4D164|nr:hypothetical protein [Klebsiella pneumoniae]EKX4996240.1 hypothetical protein [Klebsiella pneumoniae]EKX5012894.1 hypothetical protein [Klebsiella pneumoniae]EKX6663847.1 hypothetical protein [Klebsiella pneumoniae]THI83163.1 hypothetical protein E9159_19800 [Klebsiella pneumoniae subsp. pneumoniae]HBY8231907.1 hypothetical protein [Klebsiella pneumoniae]
MTDITELAQRMKAAAVRAKTATEEYASGHMSVSVCFAECEEFNRLTDGPDNILALVEALEKAQQTEKTLESRNRRLDGIITAAEQRIAELESRTVTVKLPQRLQPGADGWDDWYMHSDNEGEYLKFDDVLAMLTAAGIKVEAE